MDQYINKSEVIAEIRKRKNLNVLNEGAFEEDIDILSFLDSLEVKEVDLDYIKKELDDVVRIYKPNGDFGWGTLYNVATYFFELGLKAKEAEGICKIETEYPNFDEAQGTSITK